MMPGAESRGSCVRVSRWWILCSLLNLVASSALWAQSAGGELRPQMSPALVVGRLLLSDEAYSDLTVVGGHVSWLAHRSVGVDLAVLTVPSAIRDAGLGFQADAGLIVPLVMRSDLLVAPRAGASLLALCCPGPSWGGAHGGLAVIVPDRAAEWGLRLDAVYHTYRGMHVWQFTIGVAGVGRRKERTGTGS
jgi:hypothetical protein